MFNQKNEKITKAFVEALIGRKINEITINETKELYREKPDDKSGVLDLELEINNNEKVDVEVQLIERENFEERLLYYFSKLYGSTIKIGEDLKSCGAIYLTDEILKVFEDIIGKENCHQGRSLVTIFYIIV